VDFNCIHSEVTIRLVQISQTPMHAHALVDLFSRDFLRLPGVFTLLASPRGVRRSIVCVLKRSRIVRTVSDHPGSFESVPTTRDYLEWLLGIYDRQKFWLRRLVLRAFDILWTWSCDLFSLKTMTVKAITFVTTTTRFVHFAVQYLPNAHRP
jgi:hypothetical protein